MRLIVYHECCMVQQISSIHAQVHVEARTRAEGTHERAVEAELVRAGDRVPARGSPLARQWRRVSCCVDLRLIFRTLFDVINDENLGRPFCDSTFRSSCRLMAAKREGPETSGRVRSTPGRGSSPCPRKLIIHLNVVAKFNQHRNCLVSCGK
jgi:hypothetical protein